MGWWRKYGKTRSLSEMIFEVITLMARITYEILCRFESCPPWFKRKPTAEEGQPYMINPSVGNS